MKVAGRSAVSLGILAILAALLGTIRIRSVDFFWHLAAGRWILEHREIPRFDPFRFTSDRAPWVDHEWLFQAILGGAEALGGVPWLVALRTGAAVVLPGLKKVLHTESPGLRGWALVGVMSCVPVLLGQLARLVRGASPSRDAGGQSTGRTQSSEGR